MKVRWRNIEKQRSSNWFDFFAVKPNKEILIGIKKHKGETLSHDNDGFENIFFWFGEHPKRSKCKDESE